MDLELTIIIKTCYLSSSFCLPLTNFYFSLRKLVWMLVLLGLSLGEDHMPRTEKTDLKMQHQGRENQTLGV